MGGLGLCPGVSIQEGLHPGGSLSRGVSVQGRGLCPAGVFSVQGEGSLSRGRGLCPGGGISVQGRGSLSRGGGSVQRGLCPGGVGLCPGGRDPPVQ